MDKDALSAVRLPLGAGIALGGVVMMVIDLGNFRGVNFILVDVVLVLVGLLVVPTAKQREEVWRGGPR